MAFTGGNRIFCPDCNAAMSFASSSTNIKVCDTCSAVIERSTDGSLIRLALPVMNKIYEAVVQPGAKGNWKGKQFTVTAWQDGTAGIMVETLGNFAIYEKFAYEYPSRMQTLRYMEMGREELELIPGSQFILFSKSKCSSFEIEGEVFLEALDQRKQFNSYELGDQNDQRIEILEGTKNHFESWYINYSSVQELSLTPLKPAGPDTTKTFTCGKCGKPVTLKLPQHSLFAVCPSCAVWHGLIDGHWEPKKKLEKFTPVISLGTKGNFRGSELEVTGVMVKREAGSSAEWREYTLYSDKDGYYFFSEFNGHWMFLKEVKMSLQWSSHGTQLEVDGEQFNLYNEYNFTVISAQGEFFTSLNTAEVRAREFISVPGMYAVENYYGSDITWYKGEHLKNTELFESLGLVSASMPQKFGVGTLQPMKFHVSMRQLKKIYFLALGIFLLAQIILSMNSREENVYSNSFQIADTMVSKGVVTGSFELKAPSSAVEFTLSSPVNNSWFEASVTLINEQTGKEYNFQKGVEYYSGYSDGESWSEGSTSTEVVLSSIPKGTYHLNIFPTFNSSDINGYKSFSISVVSDVSIWRNFFIIVGLLSLYPLLQWIRTSVFERKRWNSSDYNPYINQSS